MPYIAQPGTIPHRAIAHLRTLPAGGEICGTELAECLDIASETLVTTLVTACKHGAIDRRKAVASQSNRKVWWCSLGDGTPEAPGELADEPLTRRVKAAPAAVPDVVQPIRTRETAPQDFDAWLSTRGTLRLQGVPLTADGMVVLTPDQTAAVKRLIAWSGAC